MAAIPGRTLADCNNFASLFDNTCPSVNGAPQEMDLASSASGVTVSCTGQMRCPGTSGAATYTSSNPCTFVRKLCVSCFEDAGTVKILVQSNGLPNHCFFSTVNVSVATEHEWQVAFNSDVSSVENYTASDFDTSAKTDEILCDIQRTSSANMLSSSSYVLNSRRMLHNHPGGHSGGGGSGGGGTSGGGTSGGGSGSV